MRVFPLRAVLICTVFITLLCYNCTPALCQGSGKLDDFEKDATTSAPAQNPQSNQNQDSKQSDNDSDNSLDNTISTTTGDLLRPMMRFVGWMGIESWDRVANPARCQALGLTQRQLGDPLLPEARLDLDYRPVSGGIHAFDVFTVGGYGPLGVQYSQMNYYESQPSESLRIRELYALYRISPSSSYEVGLGMGQMSLDGDEHTDKFAVTVPILYHSARTHLGIEYRPAWADRVDDQDLALLYSWRYTALKAGYRWVESPNVSLNGPYLGISWRL